MLKAQYNSTRDTYCGMPLTDDHTFDVELVDNIVYQMKRGKAAGLDNLTIEHLQYIAIQHYIYYWLSYLIFS